MSKNIELQTKVALLVCVSSVLSVVAMHYLGNESLLINIGIALAIAIALSLSLKSSLQNPLADLVNILKTKTRNDSDLTSPIAKQSDRSSQMIVDQLNIIFEKVNHISTEFAKSTNELAFTASQMSDSTERTAKNTNQQYTETDLVATAMHEMNTAVEEVARNASDASLSAKNAKESADKGTSVAQVTKDSIGTLVEDINKASSVIHDLENHSQNIGGVLGVIKGIAEQTNLLALNAAIEAARAGEQGRGFAVVADEVRTLANRTQESTQEIETMIERLVNGVNETVSVMQVASDKGHECFSQVDNTLSSLNEILMAVEAINDMNTQIATAAEEQSHVANEVNMNISNITTLASQTSKDASEAKQKSEQLANISSKMKKLVSGISISNAALDLSSAKAAHLNWKTRLRSFLDGKESLTMEQAVSHHHCEFGKWYYSQGLSNFGHIHAIAAVEEPHAELHELIKTIIDLKTNGHTSEAEKAYEMVDNISRTIVNFLDQAEQEANRSNVA